MNGLELILCITLGAIALLHVSWAFGFWLPIRDEARLVRAVVGAKGATRMPGPIPCGLVAGALLAVTALIYANPSAMRTALLGIAGFVLIVRGCLPWVRFWRQMTPVEPFATLDRRAFGPLCLMLGVGIFVVIAV